MAGEGEKESIFLLFTFSYAINDFTHFYFVCPYCFFAFWFFDDKKKHTPEHFLHKKVLRVLDAIWLPLCVSFPATFLWVVAFQTLLYSVLVALVFTLGWISLYFCQLTLQAPEAITREDLIKNHYMARIVELTSQLQLADSKAVHFHAEVSEPSAACANSEGLAFQQRTCAQSSVSITQSFPLGFGKPTTKKDTPAKALI